MHALLLLLCLAAAVCDVTGQCAADTCQNGGVCVIVIGAASCACPAGYTGLRCQSFRPTAPTCPAVTSTKATMGCGMKEVVFMIEYARGDSQNDVDHEGDFIKDLIAIWQLGNQNVRVGIVTYHDTVQDVIHIDQFANDPYGLTLAITNLTRQLQPSGENDLGLALDFVRTNAFTGSRPGAEKIVVPIVHMMPRNTKDKILPAANALKDDCVTIVGMGVRGNRFFQQSSSLDEALMAQAVTQPPQDHYDRYNSFSELEAGYAKYDDVNCP